jgi:hypothetical protein
MRRTIACGLLGLMLVTLLSLNGCVVAARPAPGAAVIEQGWVPGHWAWYGDHWVWVHGHRV